MKKKHIWLILTAALLVIAAAASALLFVGKTPQASRGISALESLLSRVPAEIFQWDDLLFADYQVAQSPLEISAGFSPLSRVYFEDGKVADSTGFSPRAVRQSLVLGAAPSDLVWLTGMFAEDQVKMALEKQGYLPVSPGREGLPLYALEGRFDTANQFDPEKKDVFFLFGGGMSQRWPVALGAGVVVSSRNEHALRAAAGDGPTLSEDPRMRTLLKALAQQPVKQLMLTPGR